MGWLSKLFNLDLWTEQNLGAVPNPLPQHESPKEELSKSKADAKNRLKLVLMHDRTQLSSEVLEKMRGEIVEVISKYVEIDTDALEINLESESNTIALVANIPMMMMKMRAAQGKGQTEAGKSANEGEESGAPVPESTEATSKEKDADAADDLIEAVEASEKAEDKPSAKKAGQ